MGYESYISHYGSMAKNSWFSCIAQRVIVINGNHLLLWVYLFSGLLTWNAMPYFKLL